MALGRTENSPTKKVRIFRVVVGLKMGVSDPRTKTKCHLIVRSKNLPNPQSYPHEKNVLFWTKR